MCDVFQAVCNLFRVNFVSSRCFYAVHVHNIFHVCIYNVSLSLLAIQTRVVEKYFSGENMTNDAVRLVCRSLQQTMEVARVRMGGL